MSFGTSPRAGADRRRIHPTIRNQEQKSGILHVPCALSRAHSSSQLLRSRFFNHTYRRARVHDSRFKANMKKMYITKHHRVDKHRRVIYEVYFALCRVLRIRVLAFQLPPPAGHAHCAIDTLRSARSQTPEDRSSGVPESPALLFILA